MSPVPNVTNETMLFNEASTATVFNDVSSLDEFGLDGLPTQEVDIG